MNGFEKDGRPYPVYRNDIKFKKYRNIDPKRAIWIGDGVEKDFNEVNTDGLDYRIKQCRKEKYDSIDLSHLTQDIVSSFFESEFFKRHAKDIHHLFINNSNVSELHDLNELNSLETLDISYNNLIKLPELPSSLTELVANNNRLKALESSLENLLRLDISHNKITNFSKFDKIKTINISHNKISTIYCKYDNVTNMICSNNPISQLPEMPKLKSLDCSNTNICQIFDFMNLTNIISNNSNLSKLERIPRLESLEVIQTKIDKLKYFSSLKVLIINESSNITISDDYKVLSAIKVNNALEVKFK